MGAVRALGLMLFLVLHQAHPSHAAPQQVAISTGQQLADEVMKWGMEGGDLTLVISVPSISMKNATWRSIDAWPPASDDPGSPFSSGRLVISSANPQNRSILDMANRAGLIPYTRGTASISLDSVITINPCQFPLNHTSFSWEAQQQVVYHYTSGLYLPLLNNPNAPIPHGVMNGLGYTTQADMSATLYNVILLLTSLQPVLNATKYRMEIFNGARRTITDLHPYSVLFQDRASTVPAATSSGFVSTKRPNDTVLQLARAQQLLLQPQYCNSTFVPAELATGDVNPAEGPLWLVDKTDSFVQAVTAAAALTKSQAMVYGLPPAVLLSGDISVTNISNLNWHVSYVMMLTGPFSTSQPLVALDLANRSGAFVLQAPLGQLAIQGLVLTGLLAGDGTGVQSAVQSAFPLSAITVTGVSSSNGAPYIPLWLDNVTLVLDQPDFLALAALVLAQNPTGGFGSVGGCLDASTAAVASYLQSGIANIQAVQPPADVPTEVLLSVFQGWGINGTSIRLKPRFAVTTSLAACRTVVAGSSSSFAASSDSSSSMTTPQIVGLVVGITGGVLLLLLLVALAVVYFRRTAPTVKLVKPLKSVPSSIAATSSVLGVSVVTPPSSLLQSVQDRTAQQSALLAHHFAVQMSLGEGSDQCPETDGMGTPGAPSSRSGARRSSSGTRRSSSGTRMADGCDVVPELAASADDKALAVKEPPFQEVQQLAAALSSSSADTVAIAAILGQGASGTVFCGVWRGLPVALKTVVFPAGQVMKKLVTEVAIAASVAHPNVVATYHYDFKPIAAQHDTQAAGELQVTIAEDAGGSIGQLNKGDEDACGFKLYLVQELCAASLSDALDGGQLHNHITGRVNEKEVLCLLLDVARGLAYLHSKGIIHADLKPCNVLLKADSTSPAAVTAKLTDFGLSIHLPHGQTHVSGFAHGTPFYVAPEVVLRMHASPASDIYSLGVMMWQLYTGKDPWMYNTDHTPAEWNPAFETFTAPNEPPDAYRVLMLSCLDKDPSLRPTAVQVAQTLASIQQQQP